MTEHQLKKIIDLSFLREFCKDDHEKMANYIHLFLESAPEQMEVIKNKALDNDWPAVKTAAHSLKPQASFIGAITLSPVIETIEKIVGSENAASDAPELVNKLEVLLDQCSNELIQTLVSLT